MGLGIKTYLRYRLGELTGKTSWFGIGYHEWQSRRIMAMLGHYGHEWFAGKKVLELGAGFGDIGAFFALLGAKVTCLEGRTANVEQMKRRHPAVKSMLFDVNREIPSECVPADLIIHFGVLYHLRDPEAALRNSCRSCRYLALETECADSDDASFVRPTAEKKYFNDHALDGIGSSPLPAFVERILREEGMSIVRIEDGRCNAGEHHYDWPLRNTGATKKGQRRFWFASH